MDILLYILLHNILPIMVIILFGFLLGKKFNMDIFTMTKLNFYIYVPFFIFTQLYTTELPKEMLKVLIFVALLAVVNSTVSSLVARARGYDEGLKNAFKNSIMFYNSGNIGIPLITLVFSSGSFIVDGKTPYLTLALTTQVVVLVVQNITTNTVGFFNAGRDTMNWKESVKSILGMPTIYCIILAFLLKGLPFRLENFPLWPAAIYIKDGMISISLITLGIQLARTKFSFKNKEVYIANFLRLVGSGVFAFIILKIMGIDGIPAQALMISSSLPTAVNTALIAIERDNHPDFASQAVMTATIFSSITLILVIYIAKIFFPI
ncbi:MAG: Auxin Efflux Carrier [Clostridiales bacterium]|nr:Auxin Efflux Carrier [Clostridiales bacterium]